MSAHVRSASARASAAFPDLGADVELVKPRIALFVALAAAVGGTLGAAAAAGPGAALAAGATLARVLEAALWVTLAAASANVLNQVLERDSDRLMRRTRGRPLPTGRVGARNAILFGAALAAASTVGLAVRFTPLAALLSLATLFAYVAVYTPLKRVSSLNTLVGAAPGAAAPLLGYVALAGAPGPWAWALFAVLFVWQFPHFMAIAWIHRADYAAAGMKMLPALPGGEPVAARQALLHALAILPVALVPAARGDAGIVFAVGACLLGLGYVAAAARFALRTDAAGARLLLLASLAYLPLFLSLPLVDPVVRAALAHPIP
jgi:heme o synthase